MFKKTEQVPKYKYEKIQDGFEEKITYETEDGKIFDSRTEAIKHEIELNISKEFDKITKISLEKNSTRIEDQWFYIEDKEDLNVIFYKYFKKNLRNTEELDNIIEYKTIEINDWIHVEIDYGGDYPDKYIITTLKNEIAEFQKFLANFQLQIDLLPINSENK